MEFLGTITATTTAKNQTDTAVPFTIKPGSRVLIQPDVPCYIKLVASGAATTGTGLLVEAGEKLELPIGDRLNLLSVITAAGTANVKVFRLYLNA